MRLVYRAWDWSAREEDAERGKRAARVVIKRIDPDTLTGHLAAPVDAAAREAQAQCAWAAQRRHVRVRVQRGVRAKRGKAGRPAPVDAAAEADRATCPCASSSSRASVRGRSVLDDATLDGKRSTTRATSRAAAAATEVAQRVPRRASRSMHSRRGAARVRRPGRRLVVDRPRRRHDARQALGMGSGRRLLADSRHDAPSTELRLRCSTLPKSDFELAACARALRRRVLCAQPERRPAADAEDLRAALPHAAEGGRKSASGPSLKRCARRASPPAPDPPYCGHVPSALALFLGDSALASPRLARSPAPSCARRAC